MLHTVRTIIGGLIIATLKVISWLKFYCNECAFTDTYIHEVSSDKNQIFIESFKLYYIIAARLNMNSIAIKILVFRETLIKNLINYSLKRVIVYLHNISIPYLKQVKVFQLKLFIKKVQFFCSNVKI